MALFPGKEEGLSQQKFAALRAAIIGFQEFLAAAQLIEQRIIVEMQAGIGGRARNLLFEDRHGFVKTVQILKRFGAVARQAGQGRIDGFGTVERRQRLAVLALPAQGLRQLQVQLRLEAAGPPPQPVPCAPQFRLHRDARHPPGSRPEPARHGHVPATASAPGECFSPPRPIVPSGAAARPIRKAPARNRACASKSARSAVSASSVRPSRDSVSPRLNANIGSRGAALTAWSNRPAASPRRP